MSVWAGRSESAINSLWRLLVRLVVIGLVLYGLYRLRNIITTLFVAAIFAYTLDPVVEWLARRPGFIHVHSGLSHLGARLVCAYRRLFLDKSAQPGGRVRMRRHVLRVYATLYVFVLAVVVLWQGTKLVMTPFVAEFRAAASPEGRRLAMENKEKLLTWYDKNAPDWAQSDKIQNQVRDSDFSKSAQKFAADLGAKVLDSLKNIVEIVLLPVLAFYFVVDGHKLKREFVALLPRNWAKETLRMVGEFNRIMRAYVAGQFLLCLLAGVIVGSGLAALGVKYSTTLGVFAGITRAIPIIGPIIGGIPIILLTLLTKGVGTALGVLVFFTIMHLVESKFIMPMLIGDRMELHPVIIIVVLLVGGELGGLLIGGQIGALLGMFFAAPIASLLRVMIRRYWLHLRSRPAPPRAPTALIPVEAAPRVLREATKESRVS